MIRATGLRHAYGERRVLRGVDISLEPSTVTAIVGPNGAGKTTLVRILAGLLRPEAGQIFVGESPLRELSPRPLAKMISFVAPSAPMPFAWTVLEVVLMGRAPHLGSGRLEAAADWSRAADALGRVEAGELADRVFLELSAGEQQRVLIARSLCQDTPVILLDEPTSHLDPAHALGVASLFRTLAGEGRTIATVLHDLNLAARAADTIVFLAGGEIAAAGTPDEILTPETVARVFGVASRRIEGEFPGLVFGGDPV